MQKYGLISYAFIILIFGMGTCVSLAEESSSPYDFSKHWNFVSVKPFKSQKAATFYRAGASSATVFRTGNLGILTWALYVNTLYEKGFLHNRENDTTAGSFRARLPNLEKQVMEALGTAMFEKMPWDVFNSSRYGNWVWESSETMSLDQSRIYLPVQGWHTLVLEVWNFEKDHPDNPLVKAGVLKFEKKSDWLFLFDDRHLLSINPITEQTLVGEARGKVNFGVLDFDKISKLCMELSR